MDASSEHAGSPFAAVAAPGAVFTGGAAGAMLRAWISSGAPATHTGALLVTSVVNGAGAFLLGYLLMHWAGRATPSRRVRLLVATGFLGSFTTFSNLAVEAVLLAEETSRMTAALLVLLSIAGGLAGAVAGRRLGRRRGAMTRRARSGSDRA
ncbi:MAG: CrcB family protein [Phycisphaeraceae bacterium]|nr:CrcB family protein [Phycisphaeraceae bacterium]